MPDKGLLNDLHHKIMVRIGKISKRFVSEDKALDNGIDPVESQCLNQEREFLRGLQEDVDNIITVVDEYSIKFNKIVAEIKDKRGIS